ncbi:MAG TPA: hypothetical protein VF503_11400 [Sphingobium sp.]|uniref:hypothetical protein n=1 Tax=Sphingobium sp. TaxID=1912891 RepID=UPI002ED0D522
MTMRKSPALLAMAAILALAACHKSKDEEPVQMENNVPEMNEQEPQQPVEAPPVLEPEKPENISAAQPTPPPPPAVTQDQQTLDDADATGLTSRLPDNYDGSASNNHPSAAQ